MASRIAGDLTVIGIAYFSGQTHSERRADAETVSKPKVALQPIPINHGLYRAIPRRQRIAPLAIKTTAGANYFVKVVDAFSKTEVVSAYIVGGAPFETKVPVGILEIKYAAGNEWYGEARLFGESTITSKADKQFQFTEESGYTIELVLQTGGNLRTSRIPRADF